ncbi:Thymidylate kinase [Candidatus Gugararchaeum adminiculabundum]|nr:Thymidylate kinase [Candidatus Gugararchaeum adminiculabundum]
MLVVFEGIDGAGKETHIRILRTWLKKNSIRSKFYKYPDLGGTLGQTIHAFLSKKLELTRKSLLLLFLSDIMKDQEVMETENANPNRILFLDRYIASTVSYQCGRVEEGVKLVRDLGFIEPDLTILLDITADTALERKYRQKKKKRDRFESDRAFLRQVRNRYLKLASKKALSKKWVILDAEQDVEVVSKQIQEAILKLA